MIPQITVRTFDYLLVFPCKNMGHNRQYFMTQQHVDSQSIASCLFSFMELFVFKENLFAYPYMWIASLAKPLAYTNEFTKGI